MRRFIFNTQGTGISHEQIRRLENTQPGAGTYLEGDMSGHPLGDEIMLLDGIEDAMGDVAALEGLGYVRAGNYRTRAGEMDGFAVSEAQLSSVPRRRRAGRDFRPWGLEGSSLGTTRHPAVTAATAIELRRPSMAQNRARADLRTLKPGSAGGRSHPAGRRVTRSYQPWGLGQDPLTAEVSPYTVDRNARPDLFIGPNFYPFDDLPTPNVMRHNREFQPYGLGEGAVEYGNTPPPQTFFQAFESARLESFGESYERWADTPSPGTWFEGFGDAASDRRQALAVAQSIRNGCRAACGLITERDAAATSRAQSQCRAGCDTAYAAAEASINGALPPGTSGPSTAEQQAIIQAKLDALARAEQAAQSGQDPGQAYNQADGGLSTNQMLLIGGGVLALGLIAVVALKK